MSPLDIRFMPIQGLSERKSRFKLKISGEIGILKALGARSMGWLLIFVNGAIISGLMGGATGAGFGFPLDGIMEACIDLHRALLIPGTYVVSFALVTAAFSRLYPEWRASNFSPLEALKHE